MQHYLQQPRCGRPTCPSVAERIRKRWYISTGEYDSAIKNEISPPATTWLGLDGTALSEVSQTDREGQTPYDVTSVCDLKNKINELTKQKLTDTENILMIAGWEGDRGLGERGEGVKKYTPTVTEWPWGTRHSTGNVVHPLAVTRCGARIIGGTTS